MMKWIKPALVALRDPRVRRVIMFKARRMMVVAVMVIEVLLREGTDALAMGA